MTPRMSTWNPSAGDSGEAPAVFPGAEEEEIGRLRRENRRLQLELACFRGAGGDCDFQAGEVPRHPGSCEELARTVGELETAASELQQFACLASHDLQEPLRAVTCCLQMLQEDCSDRLGPDADTYIGYAVEGAQRMQTLLRALLDYLESGRRPLEPVVLNSERVLGHVLAGLVPAQGGDGNRISHEPLPTVVADGRALRQILGNLLSNSLKFRGAVPARVHVSARGEEGRWVFSVADNGIGLETAHAERIFRPFQRLHPHGRYPGAGIGLAICRKVLGRLGGTIWVESSPGQGSTFHFTIPRIGDPDRRFEPADAGRPTTPRMAIPAGGPG